MFPFVRGNFVKIRIPIDFDIQPTIVFLFFRNDIHFVSQFINSEPTYSLFTDTSSPERPRRKRRSTLTRRTDHHPFIPDILERHTVTVVFDDNFTSGIHPHFFRRIVNHRIIVRNIFEHDIDPRRIRIVTILHQFEKSGDSVRNEFTTDQSESTDIESPFQFLIFRITFIHNRPDFVPTGSVPKAIPIFFFLFLYSSIHIAKRRRHAIPLPEVKNF